MSIFLEYGGTQPAFDNTTWRQRILNNEEYFIRLESYKTGCENEIINNDNNNNKDSNHHQNEEIYNLKDDELDVSDDEIYCDAEDDTKSLNVEIDGTSLQFIDTETEDSEEYDSDTRILSPKRKMPPVESLEEMFLKHEFSTFTLTEHEFNTVKP
mgnify:FL=1